MVDGAKSLAELAAMKARGELTETQFEEAKRLIQTDTGYSKSAFEPTPTETKPPKKKIGCFTVLLWIVGIVLFLSYLGSKPDPKKTNSTASVTTSSSTPNAEEAEKRRKGFHCLSGWDGSYRGLVKSVTQNLREPDSFEHVETRITPVDTKGQHALFMKFRAKNGFGGTNVGTAIAKIRQSDCSVVSWSMISDN